MAGQPRKRAKERAKERIAALPLNKSLVVVPQPEEPKDRWGRPGNFSSYQPIFAEHARILCEEGLTDKEIADHFGVCRTTIHTWKKDHPEFAEAFKLGKELADDRVERTLYEQAVGYVTTIKRKAKLRDQYGNEKMIEYEEEIHIPPNPKLIEFFLKNRRPDSWKDKTEQHVTGTVVHEQLTVDQLRERVAAKLQDLRNKEGG